MRSEIKVLLCRKSASMTEWTESWLQSWSILLFQLHGIIPALLIGTLWYIGGGAREKEIERQLAKLKKGSSHVEEVARRHVVRVVVIVPVRGWRKYSSRNWKALLRFDSRGSRGMWHEVW